MADPFDRPLVTDPALVLARHHQRTHGISRRDHDAWVAARAQAVARGRAFEATLLGWSIEQARTRRAAAAVAPPPAPRAEPAPTSPIRRLGSHLAIRGDGHPRSRAVWTPAGRFGSASLAADCHGISRQAAAIRARDGQFGWRYE